MKLSTKALAAILELDAETRRRVIEDMPPRDQLALLFDWRGFWARPNQLYDPAPITRYTAAIGGRGYGKTRLGAEALREQAYDPIWCGGRARKHKGDLKWGKGARLGVAGRTANDLNQTIIHGESGVMATSPPWFRPTHHKTDRVLEYPNGAIARLYSGDVPEGFRGPNIG